MPIITTKDTCSGIPRILARRITVIDILKNLQSGMTILEISEDYNLSIKEVDEAIEWVIKYINNHFYYDGLNISK